MVYVNRGMDMWDLKSTDLIDAAEEGRADDVRRLLQSGVDVNDVDSLKMTALMKAVYKGNIEVVTLLLSAPGIDVNKDCMTGMNPLMMAARAGHLEITKMLLGRPEINVNHQGSYGGTALINAAGFGHLDVVQEMLKVKNIEMGHTYTDAKYSPLTIARKNGHIAVAQLLEAFIARRVARKPSR